MKPVILIGGVHHNILGVVRAFGEAGMSSSVLVAITDAAYDFVSRSKYLSADRIFHVDGDAGIAPCLLEMRKRFGENPVVICCSDGAISAVDAAYDVLSPLFLLPGCGEGQGTVNRLQDKVRQFEIAESVGIRVPDYVTASAGDDDAFGRWYSFPCIAKPLNSVGSSKTDIAICASPAELEKHRGDCGNSGMILQRFIKKVAEYQFIGCSLDGGASICIPGYSRILRQPDNTNTGYLEYCPPEERFSDIVAKIGAFIRKISYSGLFSVEFVEDGDGDLYFLEINMRNDGNAYCVTAAGINLPLMWYRQALPDNLPDTFKPIRVMPVTDDLRLLFHGKVGLPRWCRDYFSADAYLDRNKLDPAPFRAKLIGAMKSFLYNRSKALYRRIEERKWTLGIAAFDPQIILDPSARLDVRWVKTENRDCWFADPFILDVTDTEFIVLVEEFPYSTRIGRIARLSIDRETFTVRSKKTIIDTGSHLSFPAYFRRGGKVYIYPENSRSGRLVLYEYDDATMTAKECGVLLHKAVADATVAEIGGRECIMATTCPEDNGSRLDIYSAEGSVLLDSVEFPDATARNAGFLFKIGDRTFRPAQDCTKSYGEKVVIQEMTLREGKPSFVPVREFKSDNSTYPLAFHTFNVFDGKYVIVDAQGHRHRILGDLLFKLRLRF